jgi:hypothetical protein
MIALQHRRGFAYITGAAVVQLGLPLLASCGAYLGFRRSSRASNLAFGLVAVWMLAVNVRSFIIWGTNALDPSPPGAKAGAPERTGDTAAGPSKAAPQVRVYRRSTAASDTDPPR